MVFWKAYTNGKFKEVKEEVNGLKHTNVTKLSNDGSVIRYEAVEKIVKPIWKLDRRAFIVSLEEEGKWECSCKLFQFRGIICKHIIRSVEVEDIRFVPERYILRRWRKDVVRDYEHIQVKYYDPNSSHRVQRSINVTGRNDYIRTLALHNEETYNIYINTSDDLRKKLESVVGIDHRPEFRSNKVFGKRRLRLREENQRHIQRNNTGLNEEGCTKDPVDKRHCGKPPTKRTKHPAEKGASQRKKNHQ